MKKNNWLIFFVFILLAPNVYATSFGVTTSHPLATQTGMQILKQGGSAADAAIAAAFTLSVVAPYSSGLGGGGIFLYFDVDLNQFSLVSYLESKPLAAKKVSSQDENEASTKKDSKKKSLENKKDDQKIHDSSKIGIPGFVAGMDLIHKKYGSLPWEKLFLKSIRLSEEGFLIEKEWAKEIGKLSKSLSREELLKNVNLKDLKSSSKKKPFQQLQLSKTLKEIQKSGAKGFYKGKLSKKIVNALKKRNINITLEDFKSYNPKVTMPEEIFHRQLRIILPTKESLGAKFLKDLLVAAKEKKAEKDLSKRNELIFSEMKKISKEYAEDLKYFVNHQELYGQIVIKDKKGNMAIMLNTLHSLWGNEMYLDELGFVMNDMVNYMEEFDPKEVQTFFNWGVKPKTRLKTFMLPIFAFEGFDKILAMTAGNGMSSPLNSFQVLLNYFFSGDSFKSAVSEEKIYSMPFLKQYVYEKGYDRGEIKKLNMKNLKGVPQNIGNVLGIVLENKKIKAVSDSRGIGSSDSE